MTVKELIEMLKHLPQNHELFYQCAEWGMQPVKDVFVCEHELTNESIVFLSNLKE